MTHAGDLEMAETMQRGLRLATMWTVVWPPMSLFLAVMGFLPWMTLVSWGSALMVFVILRQRYGKISAWWWLWRGPIMALHGNSRPGEIQWLNENMPEGYADLFTAVKFKQRKDAMWYKLVWNENS